MATLKRYFHRLFPRAEGGQFYCNIILASSKFPEILLDTMVVHLSDNQMGLWRRSIDAEQVTEIGWLLYSTRQQDEKRLASLLSELTKEKIGARWKVIHSSTNMPLVKDPSGEKPAEVRAIPLECEAVALTYAKHKVAHLYQFLAKDFPHGMKMHPIPPIKTIISQARRENYGLVIVRQATFSQKIGMGTSWKFSQNLLLDHHHLDAEASLRDILMGLNLFKFLGHPVLHAMDPTLGSNNGVSFNLLHTEIEAEARMYIDGLIPYIRDVWWEKYLRSFLGDAIERHMDSVFNEKTKQIYLNTDVWVHNSLAL